MKVFTYDNDRLLEKGYLHEGLFINIDEKKIISFVGAGGKTTLIFNLAEELKSIGRKVIITTTTNMFMPEKYLLCSSDLKQIAERLKHDGIAVIGRPVGNNKFSSLNDVSFQELLEICDFLLIESDGSRRLPLKAPDMHEPVVIDETDIVVGVAGIDSLSQSIKDICHRKEIVCDILNADESHIISERDIAELLSSERGQRKAMGSLEKDAQYVAVINKCDTNELLRKAETIGVLLKDKKVNSAVTSLI